MKAFNPFARRSRLPVNPPPQIPRPPLAQPRRCPCQMHPYGPHWPYSTGHRPDCPST